MAELESTKPGLVDEDEFNESLTKIDIGEHDGEQGSTVGATLGDTSLSEGDAGQPPWVGKTLGHFKLLGLLGQGAMGLVIRAQDVNLGRIVALKVLRKRIKGMDDQQRVNQFLREARAAARIEHPNVAHIYEINEHHGWWYVATELIEGGTLQDIVRASGRLTPQQACPLLADAASALSVAHQLGIVNRDIKPRNLMLTRSGRCKVVDFGLVRVEDPNDPFDFTSHAVGTPLYLPPEALKRQKPTGALDVYGLGATLYYALAGAPPFRSRELKALIRQHGESPRPDVREASPACSENLATLIQRAMAIDPAKRPSASDFAAALRIESIGTSAGDGATDSSLIAQIQALRTDLADATDGTALLSRTRGADASRILGRTAVRRIVRRRIRLTTILVTVLVLAAAGVFALLRNRAMVLPRQAASRTAFAKHFPAAPPGYGLDGAMPEPDISREYPFGWRGRVDPAGARFVASRSGRWAYPVDAPIAALIGAENAVFYDTAADALSDGKHIAGADSR
jgi:tRNA A-37 threonylcarbamoyl transferase component Bud32